MAGNTNREPTLITVNNRQELKKISNLLKKDPTLRTEKDMKPVKEMISNIEFFANNPAKL